MLTLLLKLSMCVVNNEVTSMLILALPEQLASPSDGQNTDPQSMDYANGLLQWTTQMDYPKMDYS